MWRRRRARDAGERVHGARRGSGQPCGVTQRAVGGEPRTAQGMGATQQRDSQHVQSRALGGHTALYSALTALLGSPAFPPAPQAPPPRFRAAPPPRFLGWGAARSVAPGRSGAACGSRRAPSGAPLSLETSRLSGRRDSNLLPPPWQGHSGEAVNALFGNSAGEDERPSYSRWVESGAGPPTEHVMGPRPQRSPIQYPAARPRSLAHKKR